MGHALILSQAGFPLEQLLPIAGVLLIVVGLFLSIRKRRARQASEPTAREQLARLKEEKAMRGDLEQLMVELEQLTKRFSAQLDAKTLHLEKLLREADERIAQLKRHEAADRDPWASRDPWTRPASRSDRPERVEPAEPAASTATEEALTRQVYELADQGLSPLEIARRLDEHVGKIELVLALRKT